MGTPFISLLEPTPLQQWDKALPSTAQPHRSSIPQTFLDAMEVREAVYVREQGVPQAFEVDDDDGRSCHWVAYASVHRIADAAAHDPAARGETRSVPVGTIRLVPFPHPPHPRPGGHYVDGRLVNTAEVAAPLGDSEGGGDAGEDVSGEERLDGGGGLGLGFAVQDRATNLHDGEEPYVKLGRLAVVREFRGHRLGRLLVRTALEWMRTHPSYFDPSPTVLGFENLGMDKDGQVLSWRGLVCCHAQKAVAGWWEQCGFEVDAGMGEWLEEGIPHVGMFQRIGVNSNPTSG